MKKYMHDFIVKENKVLSANYFVLHLKCPVLLNEELAGQFAELLVPEAPRTYLRRPFSIYDVDYKDNTIKLLIKKVGEGTHALSKLKEGKSINLIYPLGNSFSLPPGDGALLIGGGVGIAPMFLLAKYLNAKGYKSDVLIGGRSAEDILEPNPFSSYGQVFITTDDGSLGEKGMVTQHSLFKKANAGYSMMYACGPDPMMKAIAVQADQWGVPCEVSLENMMACGIGACLCCVVGTTEGNKTTCVEGPVFNSRKISEWQLHE